jgi:hypothetical protein
MDLEVLDISRLIKDHQVNSNKAKMNSLVAKVNSLEEKEVVKLLQLVPEQLGLV